MAEQMQGRDIQVQNNRITLYDLSKNLNSWYTKVYQTNETRELDERFGLAGEPVDKDSDVAHFLRLSSGACSLGKTEVELVLSYFTSLARQAGNFVELSENEFRNHIRKGNLSRLAISEGDVNLALRYQDFMNDGVIYLERINVEGTEIIFPKNLKKIIF